MVLVIGEKSIIAVIQDFDEIRRFHIDGHIETVKLEIPPVISSSVTDAGDVKNCDKPSSQAVDPDKRQIVSGKLSPSENFLIICDNLKHLIVYCTKGWSALVAFSVDRKCDHILFNEMEDKLIVSNRSGWIYGYQLPESGDNIIQSKETFLLGHSAMILDAKLSPESRFLASCDRDEKIRISNYPNCYNIESYCLGHTQFVSCLAFIDEQIFVSGSGDGTLRVWKFVEGQELCVHNFADDINQKKEKVAPMSIHFMKVDDNDILIVTFYNCSIFVTYKFDSYSQSLIKLTSTDVNNVIIASAVYNKQFLCFVDNINVFISSWLPSFDERNFKMSSTNLSAIKFLLDFEKLMQNFISERQLVNNIGWMYKNSTDNFNEYFERKKERQETKMSKKIKAS